MFNVTKHPVIAQTVSPTPTIRQPTPRLPCTIETISTIDALIPSDATYASDPMLPPLYAPSTASTTSAGDTTVTAPRTRLGPHEVLPGGVGWA